MNPRAAIRIAVACALLLFGLILGARLAVREFASPFEALERFAQLPRATVPDPDSEFAEAIRQIDWEEPAPTVIAAGSGSNSARASVYASRPAQTLLVGDVLRLAAKQVVRERPLLDLNLSILFTQSNDLTLDFLAASLKLSESQKARISEIMEWRKWSLDALTEAEKSDSERMKKIEDWYHEAMKRELDQIQAEDYEKLKTTRVFIGGEQTRTSPLALQLLLKTVGEEKTPSGE